MAVEIRVLSEIIIYIGRFSMFVTGDLSLFSDRETRQEHMQHACMINNEIKIRKTMRGTQ